ncbi:MAG: MHS family MFS transporter [Verrucomicrobia bacterium]|nr:MHS family MFS transporter [Verrucomicrobiota bacterium]
MNGTSSPQNFVTPARLETKHWLVIFASSLGTVFEWYDFYIYGTLAAFFGKLFFPPGNDTAAFLSSLALFGVGFSVRPFGALVFGRIGDLVGRKYTFLVTIIIMGLSTALVGLLPSYAQIGWAAPALLITLRILQGLALGGEYGGAATYVAEHAPQGQRGSYTSWIQTTATLGFFLSLAVIGPLRAGMTAMTPSPADPKAMVTTFEAWGWRIPFLVSVLLLAVSVYIRLKLQESPIFAEMKATGKGSKAPLSESFTRWVNLKIVLLALLGAAAGQGVVWYAGQFYALFFLTTVLKVRVLTGYWLVAIALLIGTPFFILFGKLSDRIGRKIILLSGCLLAVLTYQPIFKSITHYANPALEEAVQSTPITLHTQDYETPVALTFSAIKDAAGQIIGAKRADTPTNKARAYLNGKGIPFTLEAAEGDQPLVMHVGSAKTVSGFDAKAYDAALADTGYTKIVDPKTKAADESRINQPMLVLLLSILMIYVTMVYGPIAAFLVELFPTRIRYTSMSLPYHIGNGWFGGFLPLIATSFVVFTGNIYNGLWYPIVIAAMTCIVGLFLPETKDRPLHHDPASPDYPG